MNKNLLVLIFVGILIFSAFAGVISKPIELPPIVQPPVPMPPVSEEQINCNSCSCDPNLCSEATEVIEEPEPVIEVIPYIETEEYINFIASEWADDDKDGIENWKDRCPNQTGVAENYGCPKIIYLTANYSEYLTSFPEPVGFFQNTNIEYINSILSVVVCCGIVFVVGFAMLMFLEYLRMY